jgi:plastocyanin
VAPTPAARFKPLIPLALAAAIAAGLYIWAKSITPDYTTSLFGQTAADTFPLKSWLATVVLALAVLQLYTALWLYGRLHRARARPNRLGTAHRLTGAAAIVVSLPIAYHCLFAYGFRDLDSRTVVHSLAGCFIYGAIGAKVFVVRSKSVPGWALPLAGGTLVTLVVVLWYSSALWYFNDYSVPLLGRASSASSTSSGPAYGAPAGGGKAVAVTMKDIRFKPAQVTAHVGQTITWTNRDPVDHNVTALSGASFKSSNFGASGSYSFRLTRPGRIAYVCTLHPGMAARVTVTP